MLSLGLPPEAPLLPELDELLLGNSVLGVGTPAAEDAPPALGTPRVGDELPPAVPLDPPEEPELPPALAPAWPPLSPLAPAAPPLCPPLLPVVLCDPPVDEDEAPLDPLCEPEVPPLLEDTPPEVPEEPELLPEGVLLPDDPELPEDPELPLEEEEEEDEDEELGEDAPPLLEEDCWLTQPPTRNADTAPTNVPCAASTRMRRIAPCTLRSGVRVLELLACIVDSPGSHP